MRAFGIADKFFGAFANAGGTLEMANWIADDPERMTRVVALASEQLLEYKDGLTINLQGSGTYNPAKFFSPGERLGIKILEVLGSVELFAQDEDRPVRGTSLVMYELRKKGERSVVYREATRLEIHMASTIDHVRDALLNSRLDSKHRVLWRDGRVNEFLIPYRRISGETILAPLLLIFDPDKQGWRIDATGIKGLNEVLGRGTRFIFDASKNRYRYI